MKIKRMLIVSMLSPLFCGAASAGAEKIIQAESLGEIFVSAGGGRVRLEGTAGNTVEVVPLETNGVCEMNSRVSGKKLTLTKRKGEKGTVSDCLVRIPSRIALNVSMGAGKLSVKDVSGAVVIKKVSGETSLSGLTGSLELKMTTGKAEGYIRPSALRLTGTCGDVSFKGLSGGASVDRVCGALELAWAGTPSSEVKIKSGGGPARLLFPADAKIKTDLKTRDKGVIRDEFGGTEGVLVSVRMGGADISVIKEGKKK